MINTQAKYHHLVPQTYMSAWAHGNGTLNIEFLCDPGNIVERNKKKIAGIDDFHSIKAGMPFCTQEDTDAIFKPVIPYIVVYDGNILQSTLKMNKAYDDYKNWCITRSDGTPVRKRHIKQEIEKIKLKDIEVKWSTKYESRWPSAVSSIEKAILSTPSGSIEAFDQDYLMKFFTALDWRGFNFNQDFVGKFSALYGTMFEEAEIPEADRIHPSLKTTSEEMRHYLLLQYYRQYLDDTGVIYQNATDNLRHLSFHFLVADGPTMFITSDSPAFTYTKKDNQLVKLLPITPKILMTLGKHSDEEKLYYVTHITDDIVKRYNDIIRKNAYKFVIIK